MLDSLTSTHEQDAQLDSLCEKHGTLAIEMLRAKPGWGTMLVEAGDGTRYAITREGTCVRFLP